MLAEENGDVANETDQFAFCGFSDFS